MSERGPDGHADGEEPPGEGPIGDRVPPAVPPVAGEPVGDPVLGPGPGPRRHPSTAGGALYLLVLGTTLAGLVVVALVDWRVGVRIEAGALLAAAALRLVLPERDAGMLAVRHRLFDAGLLVVMGVALLLLADSIPEQPPPLGG